MKINPSITFLLLITVVHLNVIFAQNWPQYLGPKRDSTSPQNRSSAFLA